MQTETEIDLVRSVTLTVRDRHTEQHRQTYRKRQERLIEQQWQPER